VVLLGNLGKVLELGAVLLHVLAAGVAKHLCVCVCIVQVSAQKERAREGERDGERERGKRDKRAMPGERLAPGPCRGSPASLRHASASG
jgi:hypothetical protein